MIKSVLLKYCHYGHFGSRNEGKKSFLYNKIVEYIFTFRSMGSLSLYFYLKKSIAIYYKKL